MLGLRQESRDVSATLQTVQRRQGAHLLRLGGKRTHARWATATHCGLPRRTQSRSGTPLAAHGRLLQPPGRRPATALVPRRPGRGPARRSRHRSYSPQAGGLDQRPSLWRRVVGLAPLASAALGRDRPTPPAAAEAHLPPGGHGGHRSHQSPVRPVQRVRPGRALVRLYRPGRSPGRGRRRRYQGPLVSDPGWPPSCAASHRRRFAEATADALRPRLRLAAVRPDQHLLRGAGGGQRPGRPWLLARPPPRLQASRLGVSRDAGGLSPGPFHSRGQHARLGHCRARGDGGRGAVRPGAAGLGDGPGDDQRGDAALLEALGTEIPPGAASQRPDEVCPATADRQRLATVGGAGRSRGETGAAGASTVLVGAESAPAAEGTRHPTAAPPRTPGGLTQVAGTGGQGRLEKSGQILECVGRLAERYPKARPFVTVAVAPEGKHAVTWTWDVPRYRAALAADGAYVLQSNHGGWTSQEFWETYMQLAVAEKAFRVLKSELLLRPVWHQYSGRVQAHIFVCVLAYALWKTLDHLAKQAGLLTLIHKPAERRYGRAVPKPRPMTPEVILRELGRLKIGDIILDTTDGRQLLLRRVARPDAEQKRILAALKLELPERLSPDRLL